ncbi:Aste57867_24398 [Aphanomyces stellatus]|uniref:beta-glucosidase n=1 Tax=Aphanomyces stellatus TaxID=120398 RepID=A0A485LRE9_9STRA|nr:hypothetical protein As57867_024322 [Aphanomyces stellatus]VFU01038.1 Aste57867_24398 [Aphanomyces stellatus]
MSTTSTSREFPAGFVWGTATAAYQIEGGWNEGGRGMSIWDAFSKTPGKVLKGHTGDKAVDHFHLYKQDVALMVKMGLKSYRLSISWPRILPTGLTDHVNEEGIAFYNALIDELLANGITPIVTLYHWDLPLALQTEHDGWLNGKVVVDAFAAYARVCFERFGDRVKNWLTLNEPWCSAVLGHGTGEMAPGRKTHCKTETYLSAHNLLLAHAHAVHVYRTEFQPTQHGEIGITLNCDFREPKPTKDPVAYKQNQEAAERALLFELGWFADPVYFGDYPDVMKQRLGDRLPRFTDAESKLLKGSSDFFGFNHYGTAYAEPSPDFLNHKPVGHDGIIWEDSGVAISADDKWLKTDMGWNAVPWGFRKLLMWIQARYSPKGGIIVTENGCAVADDDRHAAEHDTFRVKFYEAYISEMHKAMTEHGVDVRGYYAWSFVDNYEWAFGYTKRFGLHWVDYDTMERMPKASAKWFARVIKANAVPIEDNMIAAAAELDAPASSY